MPPSAWSPEQYNRFRRERHAPFFDLLPLIEREPGMRVVDLGCGTGELTRVLHTSLQAKQTLGLDSSETMLAESAKFAGGGLSFERRHIEDPLEPGAFDVVFSNAALQWIPDHLALFARLSRSVAPEGQLAVQMPANFDHPSHALAIELSQEAPFREALGGWRREVPVLAPEAYAQLLHANGFVRQHVRLQVYAHLLDSAEDVVEWVKGTLLTDYQSRLSPKLYGEFLARYRERLVKALGGARPYLYPFKRLLLWGRRPVPGVA